MGQRGEQLQAEMLSIMNQNAGPISAYDLLEKLRSSNAKMAPTTVYRALASLTEQGRIHRLESMNAYVPCQHDHHHQSSILSICDDCGSVEENMAPDVLNKLETVVGENGFSAKRHVIEVHGVCGACDTEETVQ